ncbi:hypothetical protein AXG93_1231s1320 [Marchantia polymorpha subsp. ruderalis]|uniref:Homeobox domain-containing protein n=1 Tax=Marchantia polymorpha subsp. ruderalis TaxID=1480154 RepID=A0A176VQ64_MARPO|nr:hypothetical protein AXG93_1231s1320 [Marchantia polymorpha subsp. ruderalis]
MKKAARGFSSRRESALVEKGYEESRPVARAMTVMVEKGGDEVCMAYLFEFLSLSENTRGDERESLAAASSESQLTRAFMEHKEGNASFWQCLLEMSSPNENGRSDERASLASEGGERGPQQQPCRTSENQVQLPITGPLHEDTSSFEMDNDLILFDPITLSPYEWSFIFKEPSQPEKNSSVPSAHKELSLRSNVADANPVRFLQPILAAGIVDPRPALQTDVPVITTSPSNVDFQTTEDMNVDFHAYTPATDILLNSTMALDQSMQWSCGEMHMDVDNDLSSTGTELQSSTMQSAADRMQMVHAAPTMVALTDAQRALVNKESEHAHDSDLRVCASGDGNFLSLGKMKLPVMATYSSPDHLSYSEMEVSSGRIAIKDAKSSTARADAENASDIDWEYEKERIVLKMLGKRTHRKQDVEDEMKIVLQDYQKTSKDGDSRTDIVRGERNLRCFQREENHMESPYPEKGEICRLAEGLGLSRIQVEQWFENFRVRIWQPTTRGLRKGKYFRHPPAKTAILKKWILKNKSSPNPKGIELKELMEKTEMTSPQIKQWCYNFRRRHISELNTSSSRDDSNTDSMMPSRLNSATSFDFRDEVSGQSSVPPS